MRFILFLVVAICLSTMEMAQAQKFGYCNSEFLLSQIPEVKEADSELKAFQGQLVKRGQERVKALQQAATDLEKKKELGTVAPKDYEEQANKLREEEQAILSYEKEVQETLAKKRQELFQPLLDKVNTAMNTVAKEQGLTFVFDAGSQALLYADASLDVTNLVKAKLGITN
jgi:outer membrane protein